MKIIIDGDPDDYPSVLSVIKENAHLFDGPNQRLGWGWAWPVKSQNRYFFRKIVNGISAKLISRYPV